jgi:hypothetical protein
MLPIGTHVRSTMKHNLYGVIVGYGSLQWPAEQYHRVAADECMVPVYLVKNPDLIGSSSLGTACFVMRADRVVEE